METKDDDISKRDVPLYRLPRGIRRRIKKGEKEDCKLLLSLIKRCNSISDYQPTIFVQLNR
jgi:hypothetical protein